MPYLAVLVIALIPSIFRRELMALSVSAPAIRAKSFARRAVSALGNLVALSLMVCCILIALA